LPKFVISTCPQKGGGEEEEEGKKKRAVRNWVESKACLHGSCLL
jgi:hypothetical protein